MVDTSSRFSLKISPNSIIFPSLEKNKYIVVLYSPTGKNLKYTLKYIIALLTTRTLSKTHLLLQILKLYYYSKKISQIYQDRIRVRSVSPYRYDTYLFITNSQSQLEIKNILRNIRIIIMRDHSRETFIYIADPQSLLEFQKNFARYQDYSSNRLWGVTTNIADQQSLLEF